MAGETGSFSLAPSMIPPARRLFPSDATGSIRDSGSRHRGSNPRRGAQGVSTPPACGLRHGTAYGTDDGRDERSSILSSLTTFSTPHYSPLVQPVAHRPLEPLVRGSNPRRGATPIPLRNTRSLFLFRSEGHTEPRGQSLASMDTVWRTAFRQRFFPPIFPLRRNWPIRPKERRPPSTVRKGTPTAITPTGLATVCKTVHGWVRLPQSPLIGYEQSGTDTCRRPCRASPSVKIHPTSESAELRTRVDGIDRRPPAVSGRTQIRRGRMRALRPIAPDGHGGAGVRAMRSGPTSAAIAQPVEHPPRKRKVTGSNPVRGS